MRTHTAPPITELDPPRQKKTLNHKSDNAPVQNKGSPGRKVGHTGVSHNRKGVHSMHHRPKKCARCNDTNLQYKSHNVKQITDLESIPKCSTISHILYQCVYTYCNHITKSKDVGIPGTSIGCNAVTLMIHL